MIEITSTPTPTTPPATPPSPEPVPPVQSIVSGATAKPIAFRWWIALLGVLLLGLGVVYAYVRTQSGQNSGSIILEDGSTNASQQQGQAATPSVVPTLAYDRQELLFTTLVDEQGDGTKARYEHWLLNLAGGQKQKLNLPDVMAAYKHPASPLVFFTKTTTENSIFVKNLLNDEVREYQVITHPQADVHEGVAIGDLRSISPDGAFVIYSTFFSIPCPPVSVPPDFQGGFGPCTPDPDPSLPMGYYLYDIKNQANTYLGGSTIVSTWDLPGQKLYFNDIESNRGLKLLDLTTKQISIFDEAKTFGYGAYPVLGSNTLIKIEGETGNTPGEPSSVALSLTNVQTGNKQVLDSGRWADIQPFASIAPDESVFVYQRTQLDNQGRAAGSLHVYDFATGKIRRLTPEDTNFYYSINGYWSDNNTFITTRTLIGDSSGHTSLVQIRISDGLVTPIFEGSVFRFM